MSLMTCPGVRGTGGSTLAGAEGGSTRRDGTVSTAALVSLVIFGFCWATAALNMGAGCDCGCINKTLIRIAAAASTPATKPTISLGVQPRRSLRKPLDMAFLLKQRSVYRV